MTITNCSLVRNGAANLMKTRCSENLKAYYFQTIIDTQTRIFTWLHLTTLLKFVFRVDCEQKGNTRNAPVKQQYYVHVILTLNSASGVSLVKSLDESTKRLFK